MAGSAALVALAVACMLVAVASQASEAQMCRSLASTMAPCRHYVTAKGPLTTVCCSAVSNLNNAARTRADRQFACNCMKIVVGSIRGLNAGLAAGLPSKCGVSLPYAISTSTDCSKVE